MYNPLAMNKKYTVYLNYEGEYIQKEITAEDYKQAVKMAIRLFRPECVILKIELKPQLYKAFHPFQGHLIIQDYDFELVKATAWKIAERTGADIDIYDEDEDIVYCTHLL